jgi:hypothetical protein
MDECRVQLNRATANGDTATELENIRRMGWLQQELAGLNQLSAQHQQAMTAANSPATMSPQESFQRDIWNSISEKATPQEKEAMAKGWQEGAKEVVRRRTAESKQ